MQRLLAWICTRSTPSACAMPVQHRLALGDRHPVRAVDLLFLLVVEVLFGIQRKAGATGPAVELAPRRSYPASWPRS